MYHSFQSTSCFCFCRGNLHKLILHDLCPEGSQHQQRKWKCSTLPSPPGCRASTRTLVQRRQAEPGEVCAQALRPPSLQSQKDRGTGTGLHSSVWLKVMFPKDTEWSRAPQETAPTACPRPLRVKQHHPRGASEAGKETDPASPSPDHWNPGPCSASELSQPQSPNLGVGGTRSIPVLKVAGGSGGQGVQLAHRSESRSCLWAEGCGSSAHGDSPEASWPRTGGR